VTKPKPRLRPVSRSFITICLISAPVNQWAEQAQRTQSMTWPWASKAALRESSLVFHDRFLVLVSANALEIDSSINSSQIVPDVKFGGHDGRNGAAELLHRCCGGAME
jgi:hypothetical protein